jgi:hypothetical protein
LDSDRKPTRLDEPNTKKGLTARIPTNPWLVLGLTLFGVIVSVASIVFGYLWFKADQRERDLVYMVNPVRTSVATAGQTTQLTVMHGGRELGDVDITAVQIAIWNAGRESIHKEDVLEDVLIYTDPPVPILEATVRTKSRDVTEFAYVDDPTLMSQGILPISWRILEHNDGGSIQIIYQGSEGVTVSLRGTIEGMGRPQHISTGIKVESPGEQVNKAIESRSTNTKALIIGIALLAGGLLCTLFLRVSHLSSKYRVARLLGRLGALALWGGLPLTAAGLIMHFTESTLWPPFGF